MFARRRAARGRHATLPTWTSPSYSGERLPALDGIRALAVLAVIAYHAGLTWVPGGLLGVDAFFVLSGFLITTMLIGEWRRTGTVDLKQFWIRRARRLLPALLFVLVGVMGYAAWFADPMSGPSLRADCLSALGYVANWRFALSGQGYFEHFSTPSPLLHLWSLGVEEQFYVLWPLATVALLRGRRRRRGHRTLLVAAAGGAALSTLVLFGLYTLGVGTSRLYYGTDTRAAGLLVGAALAGWRVARPPQPRQLARVGITAAGIAGAGVLAYCWIGVDGQAPFLYTGGFLLVAVAVAGVVACVVEMPDGSLARLLAAGPLPAIGRISYSLYLWHWPLFLTITHARTGLSGPLLLAARLAATFAMAGISYRLVEQPIRTRRVRLPLAKVTAPAVVAVTAFMLVLVTGAGGQPAGASQNLDDIAANQQAATARQLADAPPAPAARGPGAPVRVLLVGDSVGLTLGLSLTPDIQKRYGVTITNASQIGCGIPPGEGLSDRGAPIKTSETCTNWPAAWATAVDKLHPDVALMVVGRWEVVDRSLNGRTTHIGEPDYDTALAANMSKAIEVLSRDKTMVALATAPCFQGKEKPDGGRYPQDDPARVQRFNALLSAAEATHPDRARVIDVNAMLCPGGAYSRGVDGTTVRWADGVHIADTAGPVLAPKLLPRLRQLAGVAPIGDTPAAGAGGGAATGTSTSTGAGTGLANDTPTGASPTGASPTGTTARGTTAPGTAGAGVDTVAATPAVSGTGTR